VNKAFEHGITAVDTLHIREDFDASHLIVEAGRAAFVDTGANESVPHLLKALADADLDVADVDYVFLTHVHLDHAGGAGLLLQSLPNATAVLHPRGAPHMIDPSKLIRGATAVYGEDAFQKQYGDVLPIADARVQVIGDGETISLAGREMVCLFAEGHARHHYVLHDSRSESVFTGDSFGLSYREFDTANGEFICPTTTPVHFDPAEAHKSVDKIMALQPTQLFLTHYSQVQDLSRLADDMHKRLDDFVALALKHATDSQRTETMQRVMFSYLESELREHGFAGSEATLRELLTLDVELNCMGLEFWLDHRK